jgi:hypothetical protein
MFARRRLITPPWGEGRGWRAYFPFFQYIRFEPQSYQFQYPPIAYAPPQKKRHQQPVVYVVEVALHVGV